MTTPPSHPRQPFSSRLIRTVAVGVVMSLLLGSAGASAEDPPPEEPPPAEVLDTALDVAGEFVDGIDEVLSVDDLGSTVEMTAGLVEVELQHDEPGSLGVVGADDVSIDIEMPGVAQSSEISLEQQMAIVTDDESDVSTVVQATAVGPRVMTFIDSPNAPTQFEFEQQLAEGSTVSKMGDGSIEIRDAEQQLVAEIAAPWAVDANGTSVPVHYQVEGWTVTMNVAHSNGFVYPVVADPWWWLVAIAVIKVAGKKITIKLAKEAFEHIVKRHGPKSTQWGSKFGPQFTRDWLQRAIETTTRHGTRRDNPGGGYQFYHRFNGAIGTNGERVLKVVTDRNGNVITSYPVKSIP